MNKQKKQQNQLSDSFFEAFRDTGSRTNKAQRKARQSPVEYSQNPGLNLAEQWRQKEIGIRRQERIHSQRIIQKERLVFSRKQEEIKRQIEAIQEELKLIIKEAGMVSKEVQAAVEQVVVNPGIYHINFFNKLRQLLILLRKQVADSKTWMHETNAKATKKAGYWGKVKKSGTKFLLSQERYMATQAG